MGITYPPILAGEDTVEKKLLHKGIIFLLDGGDNSGERHEISTVWQALKKEFEVDGEKFTVSTPTSFSRDGHTTVVDLTAKITSSHIKKFLPKAIEQNSHVKAGASEVDVVMQADRKIGIVECKSGGASSSGRQSANYMNAALETAHGNPADTIYFIHCYDSESSTSPKYIYDCLGAIQNSCGTALSTLNQNFRLFLNNAVSQNKLGAVGGNVDTAVDGFITFYNTQNGTNHSVGGTDQNRVQSLTAITRQEMRLVITDTYVKKETTDKVKKHLAKLVGQTYYDPSNKGFWHHLIEYLNS